MVSVFFADKVNANARQTSTPVPTSRKKPLELVQVEIHNRVDQSKLHYTVSGILCMKYCIK